MVSSLLEARCGLLCNVMYRCPSLNLLARSYFRSATLSASRTVGSSDVFLVLAGPWSRESVSNYALHPARLGAVRGQIAATAGLRTSGEDVFRLLCSSTRVDTGVVAGCSVKEAVEERLGQLSTAPSVPPPPPVVIVISGPSGVGKDAVIKALQASRPDLHFVVTATSRPKRPGEVDGVDYLFVSRQQFEEWIQGGLLLEHALVYGEYKGIPREEVMGALSRGTDVVLRLDIQGAATIRRLIPTAVSIFLVAHSEEELVRRLIDRKTEPLDKMLIRVETARQETRHMTEFDYVVVNPDADLDGAVRQIEGIISTEKLRVSRLLAPRTLAAGLAEP